MRKAESFCFREKNNFILAKRGALIRNLCCHLMSSGGYKLDTEKKHLALKIVQKSQLKTKSNNDYNDVKHD